MKRLLFQHRKSSYLICDRFTYRTRLKLQTKQLEDQKKQKRSYISNHLKMVLVSTSRSKDYEPNLLNYYMFTFFLFSVSVVVIYLALQQMLISLLVGVVAAITPYLILRMRVTNIRLKVSLAFMENFHLFHQTYYSTGKNAYFMLMNLVKEVDDKRLKTAIERLVSSVQKDNQPNQIREATNIFAFTIGSSFGIRFGNLIYKALAEQTDISLPLKYLSKQITDRRNDLENERVHKTDAKMLGYLSVIILPIFMFIAWRFTNIYDSVKVFMQPYNLMIFLIGVVLVGISFYTVIVFSKPRTDI